VGYTTSVFTSDMLGMFGELSFGLQRVRSVRQGGCGEEAKEGEEGSELHRFCVVSGARQC
jgi:hypothetical protein